MACRAHEVSRLLEHTRVYVRLREHQKLIFPRSIEENVSRRSGREYHIESAAEDILGSDHREHTRQRSDFQVEHRRQHQREYKRIGHTGQVVGSESAVHKAQTYKLRDDGRPRAHAAEHDRPHTVIKIVHELQCKERDHNIYPDKALGFGLGLHQASPFSFLTASDISSALNRQLPETRTFAPASLTTGAVS